MEIQRQQSNQVSATTPLARTVSTSEGTDSQQQAQITAAMVRCQQLLAENPEQPEIHANLGSFYAQARQWQQAIACYHQAIQLNPEFAGVYRNLARVLVHINQPKQAADCWFKALELEPDWAQPEEHYTLGNTLQAYNKLERAARCYRQVIELKPDFLPAYQRLEKLLISQGKSKQVIALYRQGVEHNPNNFQFHLFLGKALAAQQKWQKARVHYQKAIELNKDCLDSYYCLGQVWQQLQKWFKAISCYRQIIQRQPDYWQAHYQLGNVLQHQQKWDKAIAAYRRTEKLNPKFIPTYFQLGSVFSQRHQYEKAIKCYYRVLELASDFSTQQQALINCQRAISSHPNPTCHHYHRLGQLLRSKSLFSEAIKAFQQAIELNPSFSKAYINLQYTPITSAQQLEQLAVFYQNIVEQPKPIPIAWENLGDVLTKQGNIEKAVDCYRTGCYQRVAALYPQLAKLDWTVKKVNGPDFIIIGSAKCGTSSLYNYLSYHPQILLPNKKELDFFWKNFDNGIDWYLAHFPVITDRADLVTGEATPNYLRFPLAAERIKHYCPHTKLIVLLRNPVERAVSWHYHKISHGLTKETLATAIALEIKQLETWSETDIINAGYLPIDNLLSSLYYYQLKVWLELFDREQLLIIKSEELYSNPEQTMKEVFNFLELENHQLSKYTQINVGSYDSIEPNLRRTLAAYFQPYNQKLEEYLGIKFDWD